jgi:CHAT domain-containing protein
MAATISIIVTVYHREQYLGAAIESILKQTRSDFELLVWDDGSTDSSRKIADCYPQFEPRLRGVNAHHPGQSAALKAAIAETSDTYLDWVDSDDLLAPPVIAEVATLSDDVYTADQVIDQNSKTKNYGKRCRDKRKAAQAKLGNFRQNPRQLTRNRAILWLLAVFPLPGIMAIARLEPVQAHAITPANSLVRGGGKPQPLEVKFLWASEGNDEEPPPTPQPSDSGRSESDITNPDPLEVVPGIEDAQVDRVALDRTLQQADPGIALQTFEEYQAIQFARYFGFNLFGKTTPNERISQTLTELWRRTGKKPALIYVISLKNSLELLLVLPNSSSPQAKQATPSQPVITQIATVKNVPLLLGQSTPVNSTNAANNQVIRKLIPQAKAKLLFKVVNDFRIQVSDFRKTSTSSYMAPAKQLYEWIIAPLEPELKANQIDTLVFSLDNGLRSLPLAALNNGQQFLIENYSLALIPSFSLTDTRYKDIKGTQMLGMGISQATEGQAPLPAVAVEVPTLTQKIWRGQAALNQESTLANLEALTRQQRFGIIHLATHGEFNPGQVNNSYIQLWNTKLRLGNLRDVALKSGWNNAPTVDMLVLSACQTALGNNNAELGFAGLAVQSGVKTALGSLWFVSDQGSLGLMTGFYQQLRTAPIKAEALRQAQLAMLKGQVRVEDGQLRLSDQLRVPLPPDLKIKGNVDLSHPYFWSPYTIVGNWN